MTITPEIVARVILGRPDHLDDQGNPDPIPGVAELLELHGDHVTRCVADWATTLTRPGDRPTSRRPLLALRNLPCLSRRNFPIAVG